jgi:hypothetical protein
MTQLSLLPDEPPSPTPNPQSDKRAGRKGFWSLPRFADLYVCASKVGEAFSARDDVMPRIVKDFVAGYHRVAVDELSMWAMVDWDPDSIQILSIDGASTDKTILVRRAVKAARLAVADAGQ